MGGFCQQMNRHTIFEFFRVSVGYVRFLLLFLSCEGNRILYESLLQAVLANHAEETLEEVIEKICSDKNAGRFLIDQLCTFYNVHNLH